MALVESLRKKKFVITVEFQPPIGGEMSEMAKTTDRLKGRVDALTIPELKLEGIVADTIGTCRFLREQKFEPILQTTCRDKNRIELQDYLLKAARAGVANILTFTQDYRITGDSLQEIMFFHVDSGKLFSVIESLRQGHDVKGREIDLSTDFCVGSGIEVRWGKNVPDMQLKEIETLTELGTHYFLSTPVFDLDAFREFLKRIEPFKIPVIAELIVIRSAEMGLFLNKHVRDGLVPRHIIEKLAKATDKEKASMEIVGNLIKGLKDLCEGVHLIPLGVEDRISKYLEAIKL